MSHRAGPLVSLRLPPQAGPSLPTEEQISRLWGEPAASLPTWKKGRKSKARLDLNTEELVPKAPTLPRSPF